MAAAEIVIVVSYLPIEEKKLVDKFCRWVNVKFRYEGEKHEILTAALELGGISGLSSPKKLRSPRHSFLS